MPTFSGENARVKFSGGVALNKIDTPLCQSHAVNRAQEAAMQPCVANGACCRWWKAVLQIQFRTEGKKQNIAMCCMGITMAW